MSSPDGVGRVAAHFEEEILAEEPERAGDDEVAAGEVSRGAPSGAHAEEQDAVGRRTTGVGCAGERRERERGRGEGGGETQTKGHRQHRKKPPNPDEVLKQLPWPTRSAAGRPPSTPAAK